jgi:hypothetical protein
MAQNDIYHDLVRAALIAEGWEITHDPYIIRISDIRYEIDLGAQILLGAERAGKKIVQWIKDSSI